jgi:hypothetical protein
MSTSSERVKAWRQNIKQKIVDAFGGKCGICGYNKCNYSLSFHHVDPNEKEFSLGAALAHPKKFEKLIEEMKKCICVCNNCHGEIHAGILQIPTDIQRFQEYNIEEKIHESKDVHQCPICSKDTPKWKITCSKECAAKRTKTIDWEQYDLENMLATMPIIQISKVIGCSDVAVHKRIKKMKINYVRGLPNRKMDYVKKEDFLKDFETKTKKEMCKKYGVSLDTIVKYCARNDINYKKYNKNKYQSV